jgi:hypothetical protein
MTWLETRRLPIKNVSRGGRPSSISKSRFTRWNDLPYGVWTCANGRTVLFNRFYEPLIEQTEDQRIIESDPRKVIKWETQGYFYEDHIQEPDKRKLAMEAMKAFLEVTPLQARNRMGKI